MARQHQVRRGEEALFLRLGHGFLRPGELGIRGHLVGEHYDYVVVAYLGYQVVGFIQRVAAVSGKGQRLAGHGHALQIALVHLLQLAFVVVQRLVQVQVQEGVGHEPQGGGAAGELYGHVHVGAAQFHRAQHPVVQHHFVEGQVAVALTGLGKHRGGIAVAGDKVHGLAPVQLVNKGIEGLGVAAFAHHVPQEHHAVVAFAAQAAHERGLVLAEGAAVQVAYHKYPVALEIVGQARHHHVHVLHAHGAVVEDKGHQHYQRQHHGHKAREGDRPPEELGLYVILFFFRVGGVAVVQVEYPAQAFHEAAEKRQLAFGSFLFARFRGQFFAFDFFRHKPILLARVFQVCYN